jgi:small-conductance mechanosensitive channel
MTKTGRYVCFVVGLVLGIGLILAAGLEAQEASGQAPKKAAAPAISPEKLPDILAEGSAKLEKDISSLQQELESERQTLKEITKETEELRPRVAALNASMALKKLTLAGAEEEVRVLTKKAGELDSQIETLNRKQEALSKEIQGNASSLAAVKKQVAKVEKAKHPILRSREMQNAYKDYQRLAREFDAVASSYKEILANDLEILNTQKKLITETKTQIEAEYLGETLKEEILKRHPLGYRLRQLANILKTLGALPGKAHNWLVHVLQSGILVLAIKNNWPNLIGLFLFLLLLGVGTRRLRQLLVPELAAWQSQVPELGLQALLHFAQILTAHLFSIGFAAWLYVAFWTLGIIDNKAAWLIFYLTATLVALRLAINMVHSLFAGVAAGGILPIAEDLARFYRRHLRFLAMYFFLVGTFFVPNTRYLGFTPEEGNLLRHISQVILLGWVLWLLRARYLDPLLAALPVPAFLKSKGFLRAIRSAVTLVFAFVVISGLLGFRFLSDYVAEAATFTVVVLVLAWILGEGAYAVLRLMLHPEVGVLKQKYPEQERLLTRMYHLLTRLVTTALVVVAVLVALRFWGVEAARVAWAFQWLTWGPSLGPIKLTPLNLGVTILVIYLGFWVSRLIRTFMEFKFYPRTDWDPGIQYTISMTIHYVVLVITAVIALNTLGVSLTSLALVAGGLGVGIGFGLQNIVSNFISGLILLFERPIKVGDMLVVDGQWGMVKEIRVRSTIFQTFDRYILIIPNSDLLSGKILNWTHFGWGINRLTLKVGVSYGSDPRQVTKIIEEVCRANPRVIDDPPPQIFFEAYGDSSLNFNIWVHLGTPSDRIPATHELNSAIFEALQAHGIEIPFPQRDLHVRSWTPDAVPATPTPKKE